MTNLSSTWVRQGLLAAACALGTAATASAQTAFTPGNYVVLRVGDGAAALSAAATATFLLEYSPTGTLVQTIALPTTDTGTTLAFTETGSSSTDGFLTRSVDGRFLIVPGYNAAAGTASLVNTTSAANNRLVARVSSAGAITGVARLNDAFSAGNIRSATSTDGSTFYAVGNNTGVVVVPVGNTTAASTTVSTGAPTNLRSVGIYRGNLYASSASGTTQGVAQVGTGLPTAAGSATITPFAGFPTATGPSSYSFFVTDQSAAVAGVDVMYVADDRATADGGIQKWSLVNGTWVLNGTIASTSAAVRGLTGSVAGTTVSLVATSSSSLYVVTDNAGYNAAPSTAALPAATATNATTNTAFRGVALAPLATALATRAEASQQELALFPNPAQDALTVVLPGASVAGRPVVVRDLLGCVVRTAVLPASGQLSLAGLAPGTYLLTVDGSLTRRISKVE